MYDRQLHVMSGIRTKNSGGDRKTNHATTTDLKLILTLNWYFAYDAILNVVSRLNVFDYWSLN